MSLEFLLPAGLVVVGNLGSMRLQYLTLNSLTSEEQESWRVRGFLPQKPKNFDESIVYLGELLWRPGRLAGQYLYDRKNP